ncbi:MAG: nucleotidyltransferase domain-containing protein [Desulfobacterales bacterium]|nr:nucleotidyltransferase domain-containing protein [Desulfobacterales bacterium]
MIREGRKLSEDVMKRVPAIVEKVSRDEEVLALYAFGSLAKGMLKPLSDLDFGVLVSMELERRQRFDKHLELIGMFNDTFRTDEVDLVLMNDAPMRFSYNIISKGKLLFCRDRHPLIDFCARTIKLYLDFRFFRDNFDKVFLRGIGYPFKEGENFNRGNTLGISRPKIRA